ncbi:hypothetical protein K457DRAFT_25577 [Linnemannia elongata AG-77]|uniref:MD-2-related lipid-recognition domain-containing protein n=1 Tax=Linnemannia elongata AG-77 TaxID=1314771 RepID=A0A197JCT9_9FUNG|nr:hypothetical protein K457DRAFT_25577 [Linnemannia elongata AG-77]
MKFAASIGILASAALSLVSAQGGTYTDLIDYATSSQYHVTSATVSPYPMCINKTACLTLTGTLLEPIIEDSSYTISGRLFNRVGRLVYSDDNIDLCKLLADSGTPCPIAPGPLTLNLCRLVKPNAPPLWAVVWIFAAVNGDGTPIFRLETNGTIVAKTCP